MTATPPSASGGAAPSNLGHRASRGAAVTAGGLWMRTLLQLVSTMVLARLLDQSDFGLIAMIMAIVGIADLVRDFGLTGAILQARNLTAKQWSGLLWFSAALGAGLMIVVAACAPLIAALYDEQALVVLTLAVAPTLLLNGIAMPLQAAVQRELRFGTLAMIDIVSMAVGVVLSVIAAFLGWGVWSLVVLAGAGQVYRLVALWIAAKPKWGAPRIGRDIRPFVSTGGSIFGVQLLNYVTRNIDNVIIGQQLGPAALGQYSRAYSLFLLPQQQLTAPLGRVALPVLSRLQDEADRYRRYIRGAFTVIGYLALTVYGVAAAIAHPLIEVLLGPGWQAAADVFALLTIAGIAQAVGNVQGWMYISLGRAHRQFVYYLITRPIVIASFFVGIWWNGMNGLALMYGLTTLFLLVPGFIVAIRGTFLRGWSDIAAPLLRPVLVAGAAFGAAYGVTSLTSTWPALLQVLAGGLAGLVVLAAAWIVPPVRRDYAMMLDFVKQARKPARTTKTAETDAAASASGLPVDAESAELGIDEVSAGELDAELRSANEKRGPQK